MSLDGFFCRFNFPLALSNPVKLDVLRKDSNKVLYKQMNSKKSRILRCLLPRDLLELLAGRDSQGEEEQVIRFDLLREGAVVLGNVTVARLHAMDRRSFRVTVSAMTSRPADPLLLEWLCAWLLAGAEHFYLFDNSPLPAKDQADPWWLLRPLLSAELVTLLPFHLRALRHWDAVQAASAQATLQQFGHLSEWVGFFDQDEFLLPARLLGNGSYRCRPAGYLYWLLRTLRQELGQEVDTLVFESQEMGCAGPRNPRRPAAPPPSPTPQQQLALRSTPAVTTHCTDKGLLFHRQHAKIFVRPAALKYLSGCHSSHGVQRYLRPDSDGVFFHFDNHWYGLARSRKDRAAQGALEAGSDFPRPGHLPMRLLVLAGLQSIGFELADGPAPSWPADKLCDA